MSEAADKSHWQRIAALLDELLDLPEADRPARLAALCEDDADLRSEIETLLEVEGQTGLLDSPVDDYLATLLEEAQAERRGGSAQAAPTPGSDSTGSHASEAYDARFLPGTLLAGRYRIVNRVGRGGMGEVFRADDLKLGQAVALKFLSSELAGGEETKARFLTEIKLARQVAHPNVCRVYDVGEAEGQLFLSMEFIEGEDLASLLKRIGRLPREKAVQIAQQLCAGLTAAHAEGILHRDLKPANVMLDERGRVRITDFGLAGLAGQFEGVELMAGTPAYMSPEQLAGQGVSVQSDLYALGLLLYELFTGRRAFDGSSWEEVRRAREETPARPSSHVSAMDPTVEQVILRCLERDPVERPSSAREVATALPGGDPLAAALAAGETPSPELVAASGPKGSLSPRLAASLLVGTLAALALVAALAGPSSLIGRVPYSKPAAALASDAREILSQLGYSDPPLDHVYGFRRNRDYLRYVLRTDPSAGRWQSLSLPGQVALRFHYRQASRLLHPLDWEAQVRDNDPAPGPGDVRVVTDLRGKLRFFEAIPPATESPAEEPPPPDASPLFDAAGLEMTAFVEARPTRKPQLFADRRLAWTGVLPEAGGLPVRIEAAFSQGRAVFFDCVLPSDPNWAAPGEDDGRTTTDGLANALWILFIGSVLGITAILAVRNLRAGRGDRRAAGRLAAVVLVARLAWWLLAGHHLPAFWNELWLLGTAAGRAVFVAAVAWCLYIAAEPHLRRLWPQLLISWSRLVAGRFHNPLVGRDILIGVLSGALWAVLASQLHVLIPDWLGWSNPPYPMPYPSGPLFFSPPTDTLLGTRHALAAVPTALLSSLWGILAFLMLILGILTVVRRRWITFGLFVAFGSVLGWTAQWSEYSWLGITLSALAYSLMAFVIFRFGALAAASGGFTAFFYSAFPITADISSPYFSTSLFALGLLAALAAWGCRVSMGGRRPAADRALRASP